MHYLLFYETAPDYLERRGAYRSEHLMLAWEAVERGELILGGALSDPVDGAVLLFQGDSPEAAERFVASDPYVRNGLIQSWRIRPWTTVVGEGATDQIRP
ncbi:MAG: YciI-like protein [Candidatus Eisenbacteria bacterium]